MCLYSYTAYLECNHIMPGRWAYCSPSNLYVKVLQNSILGNYHFLIPTLIPALTPTPTPTPTLTRTLILALRFSF